MVHPTGEIFVYRNESKETKLTEDIYFKSLVGLEVVGSETKGHVQVCIGPNQQHVIHLRKTGTHDKPSYDIN